MPKVNEEKIDHILHRNVDGIIDRKHLKEKLQSGKKLRVKFGIDPTGDNIHIGRAVQLWKLREFQELGHAIVIIIGDFTALIGDPSDKLEKRPFLTKRQIEKNLKNYLPQIGKILDLKKIEVHRNSEWLSKLSFEDVLRLTDLWSVQQMVERRNFKGRWEKHQEIGLREFMYPIMQGYDSVAVKADVELGGTDQLFNLLAGRKVQEFYKQKPQEVVTTSMLNGIDGKKMSTMWGNVINIADDPDEQFGKVMAIHDAEIIPYFTLTTNIPLSEIQMLEKELANSYVNPKDIKAKLAYSVVARYYGENAAARAGERWEKVFSKKELTGKFPALSLKSGTNVLEVVVASGITVSKSEARRLVAQGGFHINGGVLKDPNKIPSLKTGDVLRIGKRHFFRVTLQ